MDSLVLCLPLVPLGALGSTALPWLEVEQYKDTANARSARTPKIDIIENGWTGENGGEL